MSSTSSQRASDPSDRDLPSTAYALLGLLSLRPWTTYELAQQLGRSLRWFFPRTERGAYTETKRLAQGGLAEASVAFTGKRRSTTYRITPEGRAALQAWLERPSAPVSLESEALVRVFFSDARRTEDLLVTLAEVRAQAEAALGELGEMAAEAVAGTEPFPERGRVNALGMRMVAELHRSLRDWATWAEAEVTGWTSDPDGDPGAGRAAFARLLDELQLPSGRRA